MQIVLIDPDKEFRDIAEVMISQKSGVNVISFSNTKDSLAMIEILQDIEVIICKDKIGDCSSVDLISERLEESNRSIPIISLGTLYSSKSSHIHMLKENALPEEVAKRAEEICNEKKGHIDKAREEEALRKNKYKSIPISLFKYFKTLSYDIYVCIKKDDKLKFIKRINKNESYEQETIKAYEQKGVSHLYILKDYYESFSIEVNHCFKDLISHESINEKSKEEIKQIVLVQLSSTGFNDSNLKLAMDSIKGIDEKISSPGSNLKLISDAYNSKLGFRFQRSYMISVIISMMAKEISWCESKHKECLIMAAYIHDMFLENQEEMEIEFELELKQKITSEEASKRIEAHAALAADQVLKNDQIPSAVETIVRQHHGSAIGVGYEQDFSPKIQKISILFIVAEEVSVAILKTVRKKVNLSGIINEISNKYHQNKEVISYLDTLSRNIF